MQVLYNFSLVEMEILDFQICLSRLCIAARVMALSREISGELCFELLMDKGAKIDKFLNYCSLLPLNFDC